MDTITAPPSAPIRDFDPSDPGWPACLAELSEPPTRLRVSGSMPFLDRAIAIVGTRRATREGLALAHRLARDLGRAGCVIVSGGAEGIDAAAHRGALDAGALGIVVLAGGLLRPFPRAHAALFARIAENGAALSEADDLEDPRRHRFLARNRLIAALARVVVVVQAPARSGALGTAAHARDLRRPILALPWTVDDPHGEGTNALLARGHARACRGADDVLEVLTGRPAIRVRRPPAAGPELEPDARAVLDALRPRASYVDEIVRSTGLPPARVQTTLTTLTLLGLALPDDRGAFRRAP